MRAHLFCAAKERNMNGFYENKDYGSLSEKVYRFLRDGIAEGRYQTGD